MEEPRTFRERREILKKSLYTGSPKSVYEVLSKTAKNDINKKPTKLQPKESNLLKVRSTRYKNRNMLMGKTVFNFDSNGFCEVPDVGYARYDYDVLCKMNGFYAVVDEPEVVEVPVVKEVKAAEPEVVEKPKVSKEHKVVKKTKVVKESAAVVPKDDLFRADKKDLKE